jgi:hypothetical protein
MHQYITLKILNAVFSSGSVIFVTFFGDSKELAIFGLIALIESYLGILNSGASTRMHELARENRINRLNGLIIIFLVTTFFNIFVVLGIYLSDTSSFLTPSVINIEKINIILLIVLFKLLNSTFITFVYGLGLAKKANKILINFSIPKLVLLLVTFIIAKIDYLYYVILLCLVFEFILLLSISHEKFSLNLNIKLKKFKLERSELQLALFSGIGIVYGNLDRIYGLFVFNEDTYVKWASIAVIIAPTALLISGYNQYAYNRISIDKVKITKNLKSLLFFALIIGVVTNTFVLKILSFWNILDFKLEDWMYIQIAGSTFFLTSGLLINFMVAEKKYLNVIKITLPILILYIFCILILYYTSSASPINTATVILLCSIIQIISLMLSIRSPGD